MIDTMTLAQNTPVTEEYLKNFNKFKKSKTGREREPATEEEEELQLAHQKSVQIIPKYLCERNQAANQAIYTNFSRPPEIVDC